MADFVCLFISFAHSKQHFCVFCVWTRDSVLVQYVVYHLRCISKNFEAKVSLFVCFCVLLKDCLFGSCFCFLGRVALDWQIVPSELGKKIERSGLRIVALIFYLFMRNSSNNCFKNVIRRFKVFLLLLLQCSQNVLEFEIFFSLFLT